MAPREINLTELESYIDSLTRDLMKDHEKRFSDRVRSVRDAANGLENAADRLSAGVKNAWGTLDKQTSEYAMRLAQTLQDNAQNLVKDRLAHDFHATESFHQEAVSALNDIILTVRKYAPKIPKTLRLEMTILNSSLMRLEKAVKELGEALDSSPGSKLDSLHRDVVDVLQKHTELVELRSDQQKVAESLGEALNRSNRLTTERDSIVSTPAFLELRNYEESLKRKEDQIRQFLQPLSKPLLKLERARATKKDEAVDIKTLHDLVEKPLETVVAGQLFATKQLLSSLGNALETGELSLEERKRRRAEEVIDAVNGDELEKIRSEYLALQANARESLRQLRSKGLMDKKQGLEEGIARNLSEADLIRGRQKELHRRDEEISKSLSKLKSSIEAHVTKIARQSISIATD